MWVSLVLVGVTAPGRPSMSASGARQQPPQEPIPQCGLCSPGRRLKVSLLGGPACPITGSAWRVAPSVAEARSRWSSSLGYYSG